MIFMLFAAINFNLFYMILIGQFARAFKDEELKWFLGTILISVLIIFLNIRHLYSSMGSAILDSFFQVISCITTTGFATADYTLWPWLSQCVLLFVMFVGGMAGSTGGGFKVSRFAMLTKATFRKSRKTVLSNDRLAEFMVQAKKGIGNRKYSIYSTRSRAKRKKGSSKRKIVSPALKK